MSQPQYFQQQQFQQQQFQQQQFQQQQQQPFYPPASNGQQQQSQAVGGPYGGPQQCPKVSGTHALLFICVLCIGLFGAALGVNWGGYSYHYSYYEYWCGCYIYYGSYVYFSLWRYESSGGSAALCASDDVEAGISCSSIRATRTFLILAAVFALVGLLEHARNVQRMQVSTLYLSDETDVHGCTTWC